MPPPLSGLYSPFTVTIRLEARAPCCPCDNERAWVGRFSVLGQTGLGHVAVVLLKKRKEWQMAKWQSSPMYIRDEGKRKRVRAELGGSALEAKGVGECVPAECRVSGDVVKRHRTKVGAGA